MLAEIVLSLLALLSLALTVLAIAAARGLMNDVVVVGLLIVFAVSFAGAAIVGQLRTLRDEIRRGGKGD